MSNLILGYYSRGTSFNRTFTRIIITNMSNVACYPYNVGILYIKLPTDH